MSGYIVYEGPSMIDGEPIVVIATGIGPKSQRSKNEKTGEMVQVWILRSDISPMSAINTGQDESICGGCAYRGTVDDGSNRNRACYVDVSKAPGAVWKAYKAGKYKQIPGHRFRWKDQATRLGAYGDPAAVPVRFLRSLTKRGKGHTGYSHQWRKLKFKAYRPLIMASCDNLQDLDDAQAAGWRTFRVRKPGDELHKSEITCPASFEGSYAKTCETCKACDGSRSQSGEAPLQKSIGIIVHGSPSKLASYSRTVG